MDGLKDVKDDAGGLRRHLTTYHLQSNSNLMARILWLQFRALVWKNWIVLSKHSILTILCCFILPIAFGAFLAIAQAFLVKPNNFGIGTPVSIFPLQSQFDGKTTLVWADGTDGTGNPTPEKIISHITANFTRNQLASIKQLSSPSDIPATCPQNFKYFSQCFAAVAFTNIPADGNASNPINYTIFGDRGLSFIDVQYHTSDFEKRMLPLQWAIDQAIIELQTGIQQQTPLEWLFTEETNEEQTTRTRLSFIRGIRQLLALALYVTYIGIAYQLPGSVARERALLITEHMRAMGLLDFARILSWHISISLTYLPAWIIVALIWKSHVFTETHTGLILVVHLLLGLVLASWSFFVSAPFGKSPHLAAVVSTFLGLVFAILALVVESSQSGTLFIFSVLFPPSFYIFALKAICGYENHQFPTNALKGDPDRGVVLLPLIIAAVIDVFLWPYLTVLWERHMYNASLPSTRSWAFWKKRTMNEETPQLSDDIAISIRGLTKTYKTSWFSSKGDVTAVSNLSLDIPKTGIFVLLGSNGAGKSTALSIIGGLSSITSGTITFQGGLPRPPRGTLGLVPQKNVLFPQLTCLQTLRVWRAVKWSKNSLADEDLEQLLRDCDLDKKIHSNAATLSGGQKRKLQLAIGLLGGSEIILVDECTSGVDPLSRRALWKTLTSFRDDRSIIFTTHFLDEADLLADHIAILAAPGKVVASGPPVALKRDLGEGYSIQVTFVSPVDSEKIDTSSRYELLLNIRTIAPQTHVTMPTPYQACYHLKAKDTEVVRRVLGLLDDETNCHAIASYDILGTTIEDIFLDLMSKNETTNDSENLSEGTISSHPREKFSILDLPTGRPVSPFRQAFTIFYKRTLILKRSWLTPLLAVIIAVAGATIPLVFISNEPPSCGVRFRNATSIPLYLPLPSSPLVPLTSGFSSRVVTSPPNITLTLGNSAASFRTTNVPDNATFVNYISQNFRNLSLGGVSLDPNTGASLIAWEATPPGLMGMSMLNLATNLLYVRALNASGNAARIPTLIHASHASFPPVDASTLGSLRWVIIFGAAMAVYTAFFALYVTKERHSSVQAMQLSNGLTNPIGLWLGHLMFDVMWSFLLSSIIIIIFAAVSNQFHGLGFLWVVLVLYGFSGALFSYCISLMVTSPLGAFATAAGYQIIMSVLYLASPLLVLTYGKTSASGSLITIIHFTTSIVAPVTNVLRAAVVSINMFSLLCEGNSVVNTTSMGSITKFGGPILYLIVYPFVLLSILVWVDSGSRAPRRLRPRKGISSGSGTASSSKDVIAAADAVAGSDDLLRVLDVSKTYNGNQVVDDVSLGVPRDTVFALLGPNGAGKTTTFNIIRGDVLPDIGDVLIDGISVVRHPRLARSALGVCPQFTAIDSQLSVREHLIVYGRLKGLRKGQELEESVEVVLQGTALHMYADRLASKLSGGNQRKLSLAIALIGNPSVVLIDEFSTGVDPKMKREMWQTLRQVAKGKAVIMTTHSMEEASALANSVAILANRVLAVGSTESLSARYATYEVHFTCRTREEVVKARMLMASIPGSRMADDVATRFEVPVKESDNGFSLAQLFNALSSHDDVTEYTVEKATLESAFLKVIRENNVREEDNDRRNGHHRAWWEF